MRKWLSGRASPCQGEGREFESRLPLQIKKKPPKYGGYFYQVPLAQLDRVSGYEPEGRGFESLRVRQSQSL